MMSMNVGENIGPYQLLEQVGEGGMGAVFKAYHPALDRYVALKMIQPAFREDQTFLARFQREARLVAKLEHPHIVPIYDYSEYEKLAYLVMKFIEGSTVKYRLAQGPLNFYEILQVVDSVGSALAYAHSQGVLHRDIKPSNVLLGANGMLYLADFGLARIAQAEASTLSSESNLGTPHYVSPEQAMGRHDLDKRTDIYSFGVMLYELVVGQAPFNAKTGYAIIHDHIYSPPPLPRALRPSVSEAVEQVLLKALAKDPNDRFSTVDEMVLAFKNAWFNTNDTTQGINPSVAFMPYHGTTSNEYLAAAKKSAPPKKRRMEWLYVLVGIALGIGLAFSLVPNLRGRLMSALSSVKIPAVSVEFTPTSQGSSSATTLGSELTPLAQETTPTSRPSPTSQATNNNTTPVPRPTNTPAPKPTDRPTEPLQNILTPPPVIETVVNQVTEIPQIIETVINPVTEIPPIIPSVLPLP
jgi:serine/threonine protein kinase